MRKLLDCTGLMMFTLRLQICLMGFFGRSVITNSVRFSVDGDACSPLVLKPDHTQKPRFVAPIGSADVLRVTISGNNAQVAQPIIPFAPVNVINQTVGPYAIRVQPSKAMRLVDFLFNAYRDVTKFVRRSRDITNMNSFGGPCSPCKNSRVGVVVQQLTKVFRRNVISHACNLFWRFNVNAGIIA